MRRVTPSFNTDAIQHAWTLIPKPIAQRLSHVHFFCGTDPVFAGLHEFKLTHDKRSYRDTAHCLYPHHQGNRPLSDRVTTIVIPEPKGIPPKHVIHELGHALDEALGFENNCKPVTRYAQTDRYEAFAEAFTAWLVPGYAEPVEDRRTRHQLEALLCQ